MDKDRYKQLRRLPHHNQGNNGGELCTKGFLHPWATQTILDVT